MAKCVQITEESPHARACMDPKRGLSHSLVVVQRLPTKHDARSSIKKHIYKSFILFKNIHTYEGCPRKSGTELTTDKYTALHS